MALLPQNQSNCQSLSKAQDCRCPLKDDMEVRRVIKISRESIFKVIQVEAV
jgi:hypothetical protein